MRTWTRHRGRSCCLCRQKQPFLRLLFNYNGLDFREEMKPLYHFYNEAMEEREEEMELEENCWEVVLVVIMVSQREFSLRQ